MRSITDIVGGSFFIFYSKKYVGRQIFSPKYLGSENSLFVSILILSSFLDFEYKHENTYPPHTSVVTWQQQTAMPTLMPIYLMIYPWLCCAHCLCCVLYTEWLYSCLLSESSNYKLGRLDIKILLRTDSLTDSPTPLLEPPAVQAPPGLKILCQKNLWHTHSQITDRNPRVFIELLRN